jgi:hypothetical protein
MQCSQEVLGVTWASYQVCHELERAAQMHLVPCWCKCK